VAVALGEGVALADACPWCWCFLVAVGVVAGLLSPVLITAFDNNPVLNSLILLILLIRYAKSNRRRL